MDKTPPDVPATAGSAESSEPVLRLKRELEGLGQVVAELERESASLRHQAEFWQARYAQAARRVESLERRFVPLRQAAGILARVVVAAALAAILGWPALATVLEATRALARLESVLARSGWAAAAEALGRWRGPDEPTTSGSLMDPAGAASLLAETGGLARPARLAVETIALVMMTEAIALPLGLLLAALLFRTDAWGRRLVLALIALAVFVPLPLHATAWLGALGNVGRAQALGAQPVLVGRLGAAVVHAVAALPWVVLIVGVGLCAVESELEESARLDLGAARVFLRVTSRRAIGAIAAAALAVAVLTGSDMTVTDLLQVRTYAEEAYLQFTLGHGPADAAVVTLPPLVVLGVPILLLSRAMVRLDPARLVSSFARARLWPLGSWRLPAGLLLLAVVGNLTALPLYSLIWRAGRVGGRASIGQPPSWSLSGLERTLQHAAAESWESLLLSLQWSALAATATTALAFGLAWFARRSPWWSGVALVTLLLTLATPGPVAGMALVLAYRAAPVVYDSSAMIVMAETVRSLPYVLLLLWPFLRSFPQEYLDAAALDGHDALAQMGRVVLPLSRRALVAAWAIGLALGLGELPATNLVAPPGVPPMSVVIWSLLHTGVESHLSGVALILLGAIALAGLAAGAAVRSLRASESPP